MWGIVHELYWYCTYMYHCTGILYRYYIIILVLYTVPQTVRVQNPASPYLFSHLQLQPQLLPTPPLSHQLQRLMRHNSGSNINGADHGWHNHEHLLIKYDDIDKLDQESILPGFLLPLKLQPHFFQSRNRRISGRDGCVQPCACRLDYIRIQAQPAGTRIKIKITTAIIIMTCLMTAHGGGSRWCVQEYESWPDIYT